MEIFYYICGKNFITLWIFFVAFVEKNYYICGQFLLHLLNLLHLCPKFVTFVNFFLFVYFLHLLPQKILIGSLGKIFSSKKPEHINQKDKTNAKQHQNIHIQ